MMGSHYLVLCCYKIYGILVIAIDIILVSMNVILSSYTEMDDCLRYYDCNVMFILRLGV